MANVTSRSFPRLLQPLLSRPHLLVSIVLGLGLYFASSYWAMRPITRVLIGWDSGALLFVALSLNFMRECSLTRMKQTAIAHDEGKHLMLVLTVFAAIASIGALAAELSQAKGADEYYRTALAAGTVVLSWLFVQVAFTLHYAHVYYLAEDACAEHQGGLDFGYGGEEPDYWDFLHFAIVIGATSQTADIVFKSRQMRRVSTLHSVVAFAFNTAILATMINLAAALF